MVKKRILISVPAPLVLSLRTEKIRTGVPTSQFIARTISRELDMRAVARKKRGFK